MGYKDGRKSHTENGAARLVVGGIVPVSVLECTLVVTPVIDGELEREE